MIRKRRNGLQVQVYAGRDPLTGRKRWVSRQVPGQTKRSYREAMKIEAELLEQVDRGQHRGSSSRTVAELIQRWLGWRQQVRPISPVTIANCLGSTGPGPEQHGPLDVTALDHRVHTAWRFRQGSQLTGARPDAS